MFFYFQLLFELQHYFFTPTNFFSLATFLLLPQRCSLLHSVGPVSAIFIPNLPHSNAFHVIPSFSMWGFASGSLNEKLKPLSTHHPQKSLFHKHNNQTTKEGFKRHVYSLAFIWLNMIESGVKKSKLTKY